MLEVMPKEGEVYGDTMTIDEVLKIVQEGRVVVPIGCQTLLVIAIDENGKLKMAGRSEPNHLVRIGYELQKRAFEPVQNVERVAVDGEA